MSGSAREAAAAAFDGAGVTDELGEAAGPAEVEAAPTEPVGAQPEATEPKVDAAGRLHGPGGKFAPKPKSAEPAKAAQQLPASASRAPATEPAAEVPAGADPAAKPAAQQLRPPQSWKPTVREEWAKLPTAVQEEINRREQEVALAVRRDASNRQVVEKFNAIVAPYRAVVPGDPLQVTDAMFRTVAVLRTGTATEKAGLLAGFIRDSGVPIEALAAALDGKAPPQQAQQPQQEFRDPRFDQFIQQQMAAEVETFTANLDFIEDVRDDMAILLAGAAQRGLPMDLKEAYNKACNMNPEVRKVLRQREEATATATANAATQRAKAASVSVRSEHAVQPEMEESGRDARSAAARAFRRHGV